MLSRRPLFRLTLLSAIPCLLAPRPSLAQSITYITQARSVEAVGHDVIQRGEPDEVVYHEEKRLDAPDFGPFDAVAIATHKGNEGGIVSQHSRLDAGGVTATGNWNGHTGTKSGYWRFVTSLATTFDIEGAAAVYALDFGADFVLGLEAADLSLRPLAPVGPAAFDWGPADQEEASTRDWTAAHFAGRLDPGRYEFHFLYQAEHDVGQHGRYDLALRLAPVPEPSSAALLGLCAGALLPRRRRRDS